MKNDTDPRIIEREALAHEEGLKLPYPLDYIIFLEDRGRLVDLANGEVIYTRLVATPTPAAQAVAYLLGHEEGAVRL